MGQHEGFGNHGSGERYGGVRNGLKLRCRIDGLAVYGRRGDDCAVCRGPAHQDDGEREKRRIHSIAFRATKAECLDLPETTEIVRTVELEPQAKRLYEQLVRDSYVQIKDGEITAANVLTRLLRLSQLTGGFLREDGSERPMKISDTKLTALADIVDSAAQDGKKLVVIARFLPEIDAITRMLEKKRQAFEFACRLFGLTGHDPPTSRGVALLMEMGTGKSLTTIAVAGHLWIERKVERMLIVAPLSILGVWQEEFQKFADFEYSLTVLNGGESKKIEKLRQMPTAGLQVAVINYESAWRLEKELAVWDADLIVCDEGHKIKTHNIAASKCMHRLGAKARYRILLTGTIITNKAIDVFSPYKFLSPAVFGNSFYAFRNRYFDMCGYGMHTPVLKKGMADELSRPPANAETSCRYGARCRQNRSHNRPARRESRCRWRRRRCYPAQNTCRTSWWRLVHLVAKV